MAREIKCRGKEVDNGEWVFGYYGVKGKDTNLEKHYIIQCEFNANVSGYPFYFIDIEVIPETVSQFTGLKDAKEEEVYEGDILKRKYIYFGKKRKYKTTVKWINEKSAFCIEHESILGNFNLKEFEIIGNIYDNPELLTKIKK